MAVKPSALLLAAMWLLQYLPASVNDFSLQLPVNTKSAVPWPLPARSPLKFSGTTKTRGVVARLFKGWAGIERRADEGSIIADFVRNLGLHYNESDNFNPPAGPAAPASTGPADRSEAAAAAAWQAQVQAGNAANAHERPAAAREHGS